MNMNMKGEIILIKKDIKHFESLFKMADDEGTRRYALDMLEHLRKVVGRLENNYN